MKILVGLGNPGKHYARTRHNVGFLVVDASIRRLETLAQARLEKNKKSALWHAWFFSSVLEAEVTEQIVCVKPAGYMNRSGSALRDFLKQHAKKDIVYSRDLVIIHDDADLSFGALKLDRDRGAAGHNGVADVIAELGTKDIIRLRIGIAPASHVKRKAEQFVLKDFSAKERARLPALLGRCTDVLDVLLDRGFARAQHIANTKSR